MRILHRSLLRMLPAPFFAALGSLIFILLMQFLMRHMRELIGKGLSAWVIIEIIGYNLAYMVVLAVPMSALVAALIVFGRLSESGYYRVIKASGVSLIQYAWPVWIVTSVLVVFMMYFNNQLLPESNLRAKSLWYDIRASRPAFALEPGVFYQDIDGYSIRAAEIDQRAGRLGGITVFDHSEDADGRITISAEGGRIESLEGGLVINLVLENGEMHRRVDEDIEETYEQLKFREYKIPFDLRDVVFGRSDLSSTSRSDRTTKSTEMAKIVSDTKADIARKREQAAAELLSYPEPEVLVPPEQNPLRDVVASLATNTDSVAADTSMWAPINPTRLEILEHVAPQVRSHRARVQELASATVWATRRANRFTLEIHKKFSIAFAILVFVFIGIPLGLRVRRGGIGIVSGLALGIFLIYWISLVNGEKLSDRGHLEPWIGMWAANILIGVAAVFVFTAMVLDVRRRRLR